MKIVNLFIFLFFSTTTFAQNVKGATKPFKQQENTNWTQNFRDLRNAIYQENITKAKAFFDFPILDIDGGINDLMYNTEDTTIAKTIDSKLTEREFEKKFRKIFPPMFIKCFLKIKADELYIKGSSTSPTLENDSLQHTMYATYDKKTRVLSLNLAHKGAVATGNEEFDSIEYNYDYLFTISKKGIIKFKRVILAG